jgi:NADPH-dependent 2,4-dienoyl-CoA reductase/sulfur reductase-like enzyme
VARSRIHAREFDGALACACGSQPLDFYVDVLGTAEQASGQFVPAKGGANMIPAKSAFEAADVLVAGAGAAALSAAISAAHHGASVKLIDAPSGIGGALARDERS